MSGQDDPSSEATEHGARTTEGSDQYLNGEDQALDLDPPNQLHYSGPPSEGIKIAALEAAVAAGLAPSTSRAPAEAIAGEQPVALPDWTDPPTGQVPRVLLDQVTGDDQDDFMAGNRGPVWRSNPNDWESDEVDLSFLVDDEVDNGIATGQMKHEDLPPELAFADLDVEFGAQQYGLARRVAFDFVEDEDGEPDEALSAVSSRDGDEVDGLKHTARPMTKELLGAPDLADVLAKSRAVGNEVDNVDLDESEADAAWQELFDEALDIPSPSIPPPRVARKSRDLTCQVEQELPPPAPKPAPRSTAGRAQVRQPGPSDEIAPVSHNRQNVQVPAKSPIANQPAKRSPLVAIVTGVVIGAVALGCFYLGAQASLVLVTLLVVVGTGELLGSFRKAGHHPATPIGLLASAGLVIGAYLKGAEAVPLVLGLTVVLSLLWYLFGGNGERPATDLGLTLLGVTWIGGLGSFAGLLLAPASYPHRTGVAFLVVAVVTTVANDVGAYAVGARFGKRKIAPRISPSKSVAGLVGGTILTMVVAAAVLSQLHPLDMGKVLVIAVVAAVLAPMGDLAESMIKRDLGLKDMGSVLPAHGGVLDRVDGMLLVLPAVYYLVQAFHLV